MNLFMINLYIPLLLSLIWLTYPHKHILISLISMEMMMINTMYIIYLTISILNMNMFFNFIFLTLLICESILSMSLLIYMMRNSGNDYLMNLNLVKW